MRLAVKLSIIAACTLMTAPVGAAAVKLSKTADKGLYCHEVLIEIARLTAANGDVMGARALRYYAQNWTAWIRSASSSDVNAVKPQYVAEAKKDVARKHYRYKDCGAVLN